MDEIDVKNAFGRLLEPRPPLPSSLEPARLLGAGHRALRRRRAAWTGAGSVAVAATLTAGTLVAPALVGARRSRGPSIASGTESPLVDRSATPPSAPPKPATGPALRDGERCPDKTGDFPYLGTSARGAPIPSAAAVIAAVRAATPRIAPGMRVTYVHAWQSADDPRSGEPRVMVWFDLVDRAGAGGLGLEISPFRGTTARALADRDFRSRPYSNCTAADRRFEPDGSAGLVYRKPLGDYRRYPNDVDVRASYFDVGGVQVNVDVQPWAYSALLAKEQQHPDTGVTSPPATRRTVPLTPQQAYEFARLAGALPTSR